MVEHTTTSPERQPSSVRPPGPAATNGHAPPDVDAVLAAADDAGRRRWPLVALGAAVGIAATVGVTRFLDRSDGDDGDVAARVELTTASVEQQDLREEIEWAGTLGYGDPVSVTGPSGVVTWSADAGADLQRGDTVAAVDDQAVVVFYGTSPLFRTLSEGVEGADVRLLETNLAALGYDPDATVDIDDVFTANTEAMVERWQEDIGREVTGIVAADDVVVVEGPATVVSTTSIGAAASGPIATLAPQRQVGDVVATIDGTITALAPVGSSVEPGGTLYQVDGVPVVALAPSDPVAEAMLDPTFTELELEQALADDGHDPDGEMTVDGVVTAATTSAIERWQGTAGLPVTGQSDPGYYLAAPFGHVVDGHGVTDGADLTTGGPVLTTSMSRLSVEVTVEVGEADEFVVDQMVTIELADESTVDGTVVEIGSVVAATSAQDTPNLDIVIAVVGAIEAGDTPAQSLVEGPVTVVSIGTEIVGATVVPNRALLALAEGGFAVEKVVGDGETRLIGIELGTFADGFVEVVEGEVEPGDEVVVPR